MRNSFIFIVLAFAFVVLVIPIVITSAEQLYDFEVVDANGDVYVVDYGLTQEDCQKLRGGQCVVSHGHPRRP